MGGVYNGLSLLQDRETGTYWDHITGEAVHGPLTGHQLPVWPVRITDVKTAANEYSNLQYASSHFRSWSPAVWLHQLMMRLLSRGDVIQWKGFYPPGFRGTIEKTDNRLPDMEVGLGIFESETARFYPYAKIPEDGIHDTINGRAVLVCRSTEDATPFAVWEDDRSRPMQLFTRWYGFSLTFPHVEIVQ